MHLQPPPTNPMALTPITRTPNITPPRDQIVHVATGNSPSHSDSDDLTARFDSPPQERDNFLKVSQDLFQIIQYNSKQADIFSAQQKKMGAELGDLKTQLSAVQKEHQDILKKLKSNTELSELLSEEQQLFDIALKKLQEVPQPPQSVVSETLQRNNSKVSQLKKRFSGENILPTAPVLRDPGITQELTKLKSLNVLGNPETDATPAFTPQPLAETANKLSHLQEQILQMAGQINELNEKARTYEEQNKNLDLDQFILKKLSLLGLGNYLECVTLREEAEERNQKKIAGLERTVFFQWVGGGIITLLLWLQIQRK